LSIHWVVIKAESTQRTVLYKGQCNQKKSSEDAATKVTCLQLLLELNWHGIEGNRMYQFHRNVGA